MLRHRSPLCRLPRNVLEDVAAYVVDPLGPPKELIPLLQTCIYINATLSFDACPHLYARIFRFKFDFSAARRRFGRRATYTSSLAQQLKSYCSALKAIRRGDVHAEDTVETLWNAFFMMVENDGRNAVQLMEWADLSAYANKYVRQRLWERTRSGWPLDNAQNALALWLVWLTTDIEVVISETEEQRKEVMDLVRPFVILPIRYQPFQVMDNFHILPITDDFDEHIPVTVPTPHALHPPYRHPSTVVSKHMLYGQSVHVSTPLISVAAKLIYMSKSEATPIQIPEDWPENRAEAIARGHTWVRATKEDLREFNAHKAAVPIALGKWERTLLTGKPPQYSGKWWTQEFLSYRLDHDWSRWRHCFNVWFSGPPRTPYTPGSLTGTWYGRALMPDSVHFVNMVMAQTYHPGHPRMSIAPISFTLREYVCTSTPLPTGGNPTLRTDQGVRYAWMPHTHTRELDRRRLELSAMDYGTTHQYTLCKPGEPVGCPRGEQEDASCEGCEARVQQKDALRAHRQRQKERAVEEAEVAAGRAVGESKPRRLIGRDLRPHVPCLLSAGMHHEETIRILGEMRDELPNELTVDQLLEEEMRCMDNRDPDRESVYDACQGFRDVVIIGECMSRHAQAWHNFNLFGRVRQWDGLCAIMRKPVDTPELGIQIFRGYVVAGQYFVGSWRAFTKDPTSLPLEGPFNTSRIET